MVRISNALKLLVIFLTHESLGLKQTGKLEDFAALQEQQGRAAVLATDSIVTKYVRTYPRDYDAFVLFTATAEKFGCTACPFGVEEFERTAQSYHSAKREASQEAKDIIFMVADVLKAQRTFQGYKLVSVPQMGFFPASSEKLLDDWTAPEIAGPKILQTAETLANFIFIKTGVKFEIIRSYFYTKLSIGIILFLSILSLKFVVKDFAGLLKLVRNRTIWLILSLLVYTFSISGGIFDVVRSAQPFGVDPKTGLMILLHPQSSNQFIVEGFSIGMLNLLASVSGIFLLYFAHKIKNQMWQGISILCSAAMFSLLFRLVIVLYSQKNRWYMMT